MMKRPDHGHGSALAIAWVVTCRNMNVMINGVERNFPGLKSGAKLADLIAVLGLKSDRIAVEHNGEIAARSGWDSTALNSGDKLEIVHFVGGGLV
jgi:sulfur carrier protein